MSGTSVSGKIISTVKPNGDGDFTTLALWEDWADADPLSTGHAGYWAECYKGGNLGVVDVTGWSVSATADNHPKIYVAEGQGHGGDVTDGAYIQTGSAHGISSSGGIAGLHIDGIRIDGNHTSFKAIDMASTPTAAILYQTIENCYIHSTNAGYVMGIMCGNLIADNGAVTKNVVIRNNIIEHEYGNSNILKGYAIAIGAAALSGTTAAVTNGFIHNNTIVSRSGDTDNNTKGIGWYITAGKTMNLYIENNYISMEDASSGGLLAYPVLATGGTLTTTIRNNGQPTDGDVTSSALNDEDNYPGHTTTINATQANQFNDRASGDYSLKETTVLRDSGKVPTSYGLSYISVSSTDVLGNTRAQFGTWDIGAYEYLEEAALTGGDVVQEILIDEARTQGGISVFSGGIFQKRDDNQPTPIQHQIDTLNDRFIESQRTNHNDVHG